MRPLILFRILAELENETVNAVDSIKFKTIVFTNWIESNSNTFHLYLITELLESNESVDENCYSLSLAHAADCLLVLGPKDEYNLDSCKINKSFTSARTEMVLQKDHYETIKERVLFQSIRKK